MKAWRIAFVVAGLGLLGFGAFRLLTEMSRGTLIALVIWLLAALIIHDVLLAPAVVGVGWLLRRFVPDRARRYLQIGLVTSAMVTVVALPMIYLRGSQPVVKAMLLRDYGANLGLLIGLIALGCLILYAVRVRRDRAREQDAGTAE